MYCPRPAQRKRLNLVPDALALTGLKVHDLRFNLAVGIALPFLLLAATPSGARTWRVEADGSGDAPTIQAVFNLALEGDSILAGPGIYREAPFLTGGKSVHLLSRDGPSQTVIDGEGIRIGIAFSAGTVEGFTIRNAIANGVRIGRAPGAMTSPTFRNNVVEQNRSPRGGGVYIDAFRAHLIGNTIRFNHADEVGGGIYDVGAETFIEENIIAFNTAGWFAGGLASAEATIRHNIIAGNFAQLNAGGASLEGCFSFAHNTVYGNRTANGIPNGGGVVMNFGFCVVEANIIAQNRGGGNAIGLIAHEAATVRCNDVWGNDIDSILGADDGTNFSVDPLFCASEPLEALQFDLRANSPCLPGQSPVGQCGGIGARGLGCGNVSAVATSWTQVKQAFR